MPKKKSVDNGYSEEQDILFDRATKRIKVRATQLGYIDHVRRYVRDVFFVSPAQFSSKWMVEANPNSSLTEGYDGQKTRNKWMEIINGVDNNPTGNLDSEEVSVDEVPVKNAVEEEVVI